VRAEVVAGDHVRCVLAGGDGGRGGARRMLLGRRGRGLGAAGLLACGGGGVGSGSEWEALAATGCAVEGGALGFGGAAI
jgi:hypothetical protein